MAAPNPQSLSTSQTAIISPPTAYVSELEDRVSNIEAPPVHRQHPDVYASAPTAKTPARVDASSATGAIPKAGTATSRRMRPLRAWMLALPIDFVAAAAPALWFESNWRGIVSMAALTVVTFGFGGFYRGRRHLSFLDELPSLVGRLLTAAAAVAVISAQRHDSVAYVGNFMHSVAVSAGLVLVGRMLSRKIVLVARRRQWASHGALIVRSWPSRRGDRAHPAAPSAVRTSFRRLVDDVRPQADNGMNSWIGVLDSLEQLIEATETDVIISPTPPLPKTA